MPSAPKQTLGYIALQLKAQKVAADQAAKREKDQFDREAAQQDKALNVKSIDSAFKNYNEGENRKLQLAGLMGRSAESNEVRRAIAEMGNQTKRDIETGKNEDRDAERNRKLDTDAAKLTEKMSEFEHKREEDATKDKQKDYELVTGRAGLEYKNPFAAPSVKVGGNGLPEGRNYGTPSEDGGNSPTGSPKGSSNPDMPGEAPPTTAKPSGRVKDTPADKSTIDAAMKAVVAGAGVESAFKRAEGEMSKVDKADYGAFEEPSYIGIPKGVPGVGGFGINIPGNNQLEKKALDMGLGSTKPGRKLVQFMKGDALQDDPGEAALKEKVQHREIARSAAADLSSQIGVLRLGTTSSAKQDEKIDKILGMSANAQFGQDKDFTMNTLGEMHKEAKRLMRVHKYIAENHALPLEDLPDVEAQANAVQSTSSQTPGQMPGDVAPSPAQAQANGPTLADLLSQPQNGNLRAFGQSNPQVQRSLQDFFRSLPANLSQSQKTQMGYQHLRELFEQSRPQTPTNDIQF